MKLNVSFAELQRNADRMGDHSSKFTIDLNASSFELDEALSSSVGIEVTVDELDFDTGLLAYESRQVILFIPEQRRSISEVLQDGSLGTKYHIADCRTLNEMRRKNDSIAIRSRITLTESSQFMGVIILLRRRLRVKLNCQSARTAWTFWLTKGLL